MSYEDSDEYAPIRAETLRDSSRTGEPPKWTPAVIVATWPCKVCKRPVDIPEVAAERLAAFNVMLAARGELPLDPSRILFCASCEVEYRATAPARRRGQIERMRPVIQQVKESNDPERERDAIKQLIAWGHPDVEGLVKSCADRLKGGKRRMSAEDVMR